MEKITEVLSREHQVVLRKLDEFEKSLENYAHGKLREVVRFFDERLALHRRKEEEVLFPTLATRFPPDTGPVHCMLEEHQDEKAHLEALRNALEDGNRKEVLDNGRYILALLRRHIWKEDNILFPLAEQYLDTNVREAVRAGFEAIGACCAECGHELVTVPPQGEWRIDPEA